MKLAIIGSSPMALEAVLRFHVHEANLSWFNADFFIEDLISSPIMNWEDATSELGLQILKGNGGSDFTKESFSWQKWQRLYYQPLMEFIKTAHPVKTHKVLSVTKRFLAANETIKGKSRFYDLFRVIYQLNPEEFINEQKESDPETYKRLSEEFMQSLQSSLEMYEDFDLVMDLRHELQARSMAVTGRALGEGRVSTDKVHYGWDALKRSKEYLIRPDVRELCLVGSGDLAAEILVDLERWLSDPRSRLFIISHEENPFENFLSYANENTKMKVEDLFKKMEEEFQLEAGEFHKKIREWQELNDFVQVKVPKPTEPVPRLVFFSGHNATAIDQLIDRRRLFVTLEKPEFREGLKQPQNNDLDLKTIGMDEVLVANGVDKEPIARYLDQNESGYFAISPKRPTFKNSWKEDKDALQRIENEVFRFFSPADSHKLQQ